MTNKKFINQKEPNNKTRKIASGLCCVALLDSDWFETLTQFLTIYLETLGKSLVWFNGWIKSYICLYKTR
jgi:hypothetical protein